MCTSRKAFSEFKMIVLIIVAVAAIYGFRKVQHYWNQTFPVNIMHLDRAGKNDIVIFEKLRQKDDGWFQTNTPYLITDVDETRIFYISQWSSDPSQLEKTALQEMINGGSKILLVKPGSTEYEKIHRRFE